MASAHLKLMREDEEATAEEQMATDMQIKWETPSTRPNPDDYITIHGSRMVRPYFFEFKAHVKRRWAGKSIVDLFTQEFRQRPRNYYEEAVKLARIRVEGKIVGPLYVVRDSQTMSHFVHRHEPPVLAGAVTVLEEGPDVITVCKPASVPVHPCGQYRKNTVVSILEAEHKTGPLFPVHRLDRLVSGLLILARNARTADFFRQEIEAGVVEKQYVAKVKGVFPADEVEVNAAVTYDPREGRSSVEVKAPVCEKGAEVHSNLQGNLRPNAQESDAKGKNAYTKFQRLSTDGVSSVVRCMPQTGRTHQIRVHLQHLGYPIANDALYLHSNVAKRSRRNSTADRAASLAIESSENVARAYESPSAVPSTVGCGKSEENGGLHVPMGTPFEPSLTITEQEIMLNSIEQGQRGGLHDSAMDVCKDTSESAHQLEVRHSARLHFDDRLLCEADKGGQVGKADHLQANTKSNKLDFVVDPLCTHCPNFEPSGYIGGEEGLWLHCIRYSGSSWAYECPLPEWAL